MANFTFNIAKGALKTFAQLGAAADALILVPLETSGLESDATLIDKDTLADVVSGTTNEQTTAGRKTLANVTVTVDDTNDRLNIDADDVTYTGVAASNAISKWVIAYDGDTGAGTDANITPLTAADLAWTPDGNNFTLSIADFARVT